MVDATDVSPRSSIFSPYHNTCEEIEQNGVFIMKMNGEKLLHLSNKHKRCDSNI
ncbi:hypothetical protein HanIR_Chr15g0755311 [Helianthus annuus]|nr:hypothetical protein HanIR_Chr15g0755311 [Helianthus annuus]